MAVREFSSKWDISGSADFIQLTAAKCVALQFPDDLLGDSFEVAEAVENELQHRQVDSEVFILADTTFNNLAVDEVAAQHVDAQAVIHYGRASLSSLSHLPAYFVFGHAPLDVSAVALRISSFISDSKQRYKAVVVLPDQLYCHACQELQSEVAAAQEQDGSRDVARPAVVIADITRTLRPHHPNHPGVTPSEPTQGHVNQHQSDTPACVATHVDTHVDTHLSGLALTDEDEERRSSHYQAAGLSWCLPVSVGLHECAMLWLGPEDAPALHHLLLMHSALQWVMYDPHTGSWEEGVPATIARLLKKRYYLVERAKNANIVGLIVGTLSVSNHVEVIDKLRGLILAGGKKSYTILAGKPNPAKLGNFAEVDVWVMVADEQGLILDSKDYYVPIITPYEALLAFVPGLEWDPQYYKLDFNALLDGQLLGGGRLSSDEPRFSLLDGRYHEDGVGVHGSGNDALSEGAVNGERAIMVAAQKALQPVAAAPGHIVEARSAAEYLVSHRSYKGLECPAMGAEPKVAEKAAVGLSGRAAHYTAEPSPTATQP